jgi:hypothetical protein
VTRRPSVSLILRDLVGPSHNQGRPHWGDGLAIHYIRRAERIHRTPVREWLPVQPREECPR